MINEATRQSQDPAEGSRRTIEHELQDQEKNNRESGARKLEKRRDDDEDGQRDATGRR